MSWTKKAIDADGASRIARACVRWRQWLGEKQMYAMADAGAALGVSPRYVRALVRGEFTRVPSELYRLMLHRWWADMDRQAAELRRHADQIERQAEAERLAGAQLTLPLPGGDQCNSYASSLHASVSGAGRLPNGRWGDGAAGSSG